MQEPRCGQTEDFVPAPLAGGATIRMRPVGLVLLGTTVASIFQYLVASVISAPYLGPSAAALVHPFLRKGDHGEKFVKRRKRPGGDDVDCAREMGAMSSMRPWWTIAGAPVCAHGFSQECGLLADALDQMDAGARDFRKRAGDDQAGKAAARAEIDPASRASRRQRRGAGANRRHAGSRGSGWWTTR